MLVTTTHSPCRWYAKACAACPACAASAAGAACVACGACAACVAGGAVAASKALRLRNDKWTALSSLALM